MNFLLGSPPFFWKKRKKEEEESKNMMLNYVYGHSTIVCWSRSSEFENNNNNKGV